MKLTLSVLILLSGLIMANPFQLNVDLNQYNDTILQIEEFEYNSDLFEGFGNIFDSEGIIQGGYDLFKLGSVSHFGPIYATLFYTPYTPMNYTKTFSVVSSLGGKW